MNINKALNFIEKTGDPVLISLAHYTVGKIKQDEVIAAISVYQLSDGGWTKTE